MRGSRIYSCAESSSGDWPINRLLAVCWGKQHLITQVGEFMSPNCSTLAFNSATSLCCCIVSLLFPHQSPSYSDCDRHLLSLPLFHTFLSDTVRRAVLLPLHFHAILIQPLPFVQCTLLPFLCALIGAYA